MDIMNYVVAICSLLLVLIILLLNKNTNKDIVVLMWYDEGIKEYADIAYQINKKWCDKHGVELVKCAHVYEKNRHQSWQKVYFMKELLDKRPQCKYLLWIDADAVINPTKKHHIHSFIESGKDFVLSKDCCGKKGINFGTLFAKNTQFVRDTLEVMINSETATCKNSYKKGNWEQDCFNHLLSDELKSHSYIYNYGVMQHFHEDPGAFIWHYAGTSKEARLDIFGKLKDKYLKHNIKNK